MPKFAANLTTLFTEVSFLDRFEAAASSGFKAVEFLFPYDWPVNEVKAALNCADLPALLINTPPGDWEAGERGLAALPGREEEFRQELARALEYAHVLNVGMLHVMAGVQSADCSYEESEEVFRKNLAYAASQAAALSIGITIEPINDRDVPGYFLTNMEQAIGILTSLGLEHVHLQLDIYHLQVMEGRLSERICEVIDFVRHIQISGCPGRHEPDDLQEINYPYLFGLLDRLGYDGWVSCEYQPRGSTREGLGWGSKYGLV